MSTHFWRLLCRGGAVLVLFLAGAPFSAAQPLAPPVPDDGRRPAPQAEGREPGYLGLIADDRRDQGAGLRVVRVVEGSPAAMAGIEVNDLITAIDGQAVGSLAAMGAQLEPRAADDKIRFEIRRAGDARTIDVTLGRRPPQGERPFQFGRIPERLPEPPIPGSSATATPPRGGPPPGVPTPQASAASRGQLLGIRSGPVSEETRVRLGVPEAGGALVVARVVGSPADKAGIPLDAVIVSVDEQPVSSSTHLARLIEAAGPGTEVAITYFTRGERQTAAVTLGSVAAPARPMLDAPPLAERGDLLRPPGRQVAPPVTESARIEQLERRIRELEKRLELIEQALRRERP